METVRREQTIAINLTSLERGDRQTETTIPEVLQISDGTDSEEPLAATEFVTALATEPYCKGIAKMWENRELSIPTTAMDS